MKGRIILYGKEKENENKIEKYKVTNERTKNGQFIIVFFFSVELNEIHITVEHFNVKIIQLNVKQNFT